MPSTVPRIAAWLMALLLAVAVASCHKSDATRLGPPSNVTARIGDSQVTLQWDPAQGASGYNVYWSETQGAGTNASLRAQQVSSPYTVSGLTNQTRYYFTVTSLNGGGESAASQEVSATPHPPEWTWVGGSNSSSVNAIYGTKGVAATTNLPGARSDVATWSVGKTLWLFGGYGRDGSGNSGQLNDLWRYDRDAGTWTWVSGSDSINASGAYGTQGTASTSNAPGARHGAVTWSTSDGRLWLFGGSGYDELSGTLVYLNDLWVFDPISGQWTWISGVKSGQALAVYGTQGTAASSNVPSGRQSAVAWTGTNGKLWLFGGYGFSYTASQGLLNDLWRYDPASNEWTWVAGTNSLNVFSVYGTQGTASVSNLPGARQTAVSWIDGSGNLWLFGGNGYDTSALGDLNDLWKYDVSTGYWTWVGGSNVNGDLGTYGTQGVGSTSNIPPARNDAKAWTDGAGHFWLFGGVHTNFFNDLWQYDPSSNEWTWMAGSSTVGASSVYGTLGVPDPGNVPGSRYGPAAWADGEGTLWLFGGASAAGVYSDLWQWNPVP